MVAGDSRRTLVLPLGLSLVAFVFHSGNREKLCVFDDVFCHGGKSKNQRAESDANQQRTYARLQRRTFRAAFEFYRLDDFVFDYVRNWIPLARAVYESNTYERLSIFEADGD